jgi:hypothetical protein
MAPVHHTMPSPLGDLTLVGHDGALSGLYFRGLCIVVPCHRVVGSTGKLTGYAGGLRRKRSLLDLEQEPASQIEPGSRCTSGHIGGSSDEGWR